MTRLIYLAQATNRIIKAGSLVLAIAVAIPFGLVVALTFFDVSGRLAMDKPIRGTIELTQMVVVLMTFLVPAFVMRARRHITIDILTDRLHLRSKAILESFTVVLSLAFFIYFAWQSAEFTVHMWQIKQYSPLLEIPLGVVWTGMTIGLSWLSLELFVRLVDLIRGLVKGS